MARHRWAAACIGCGHHLPVDRGLYSCGARCGHRAQPGFQWRAAIGRRHHAIHDVSQPALERGRCLSFRDRQRCQSHRAHRLHGVTRHSRGPALHWRRVSERRHRDHRTLRWRGADGGGQLQHAQNPHAVGHRPGRPSGANGRQDAAWARWGRRKPAGSPRSAGGRGHQWPLWILWRGQGLEGAAQWPAVPDVRHRPGHQFRRRGLRLCGSGWRQ